MREISNMAGLTPISEVVHPVVVPTAGNIEKSLSPGDKQDKMRQRKSSFHQKICVVKCTTNSRTGHELGRSMVGLKMKAGLLWETYLVVEECRLQTTYPLRRGLHICALKGPLSISIYIFRAQFFSLSSCNFGERSYNKSDG